MRPLLFVKRKMYIEICVVWCVLCCMFSVLWSLNSVLCQCARCSLNCALQSTGNWMKYVVRSIFIFNNNVISDSIHISQCQKVMEANDTELSIWQSGRELKQAVSDVFRFHSICSLIAIICFELSCFGFFRIHNTINSTVLLFDNSTIYSIVSNRYYTKCEVNRKNQTTR